MKSGMCDCDAVTQEGDAGYLYAKLSAYLCNRESVVGLIFAVESTVALRSECFPFLYAHVTNIFLTLCEMLPIALYTV